MHLVLARIEGAEPGTKGLSLFVVPRVRVNDDSSLGEDNDVTSELDFSLVATTYGVGSRSLGSLGILGPARMEYPRIVPLVRYLGETLSKALTTSG